MSQNMEKTCVHIQFNFFLTQQLQVHEKKRIQKGLSIRNDQNPNKCF